VNLGRVDSARWLDGAAIAGSLACAAHGLAFPLIAGCAARARPDWLMSIAELIGSATAAGSVCGVRAYNEEPDRFFITPARMFLNGRKSALKAVRFSKVAASSYCNTGIHQIFAG
jgi:hypothetical protein